ncbi:Hypothetical protein PBC10988_28810 [Planctomycetales bacterium 10988]|nr:Hypothetical protein PBC10988_28810 [Planctomycetales bacterium 10988]
MRKLVHTGIVLGVGFIACGLLFGLATQTAEARPWFPKDFSEKYPDLDDKVREVKRCGVCHPAGEKKSVRNAYGQAMFEALGMEENVKGEAVGEALEAIESKPSSVPGKTYGDQIEAGELPN